MQSTVWQPEHSEALKGHIEAGLSSAEAAAEINAQFNTSYSRSAVIGRANRMGLARPSKIAIPRKHRPYKPRIRRVNGNSNAMQVLRPLEIEHYKLRCVEIVPRHVSLLDLEPNDCRYPYGDGPITFCGHAKMPGSSYCVPHYALSIGPGTSSERHATKVSTRILEVA